MKRQATPEQKAAAEAKRAKFRAIWKQIAEMPEADRIAMSNRLGIVNPEGHALSIKNQCLIALQFPTASVVGGFRQWIKQGRAVMKGQHGFNIWIPIGYGNMQDVTRGMNADASQPVEDPGFVVGTVFDISQTQPITDTPETNEAIVEHAGNLALC